MCASEINNIIKYNPGTHSLSVRIRVPAIVRIQFSLRMKSIFLRAWQSRFLQSYETIEKLGGVLQISSR